MNKNTVTRFNNILVLFDLLKKIKKKDIYYIKQLYLQNAVKFEECIDFISSLKLINIKSNQIEISNQLTKFLLKQPKENEVREFVLHKLLNKRNGYFVKDHFIPHPKVQIIPHLKNVVTVLKNS